MGDDRMMTHFKGGAAALCLALLTTPAFGQTASPAQTPDATVVAQAKGAAASDDAAPARRKRAKAATKSDGKPTAGQTAARERQKACAAEWKTAKADGKIETGMKWPKYWSQCNTRLKAEKA
jgi:hypothetical protein